MGNRVRFIFRPRVDFLCWDIRLFLSETVSFSPRDLPPTVVRLVLSSSSQSRVFLSEESKPRYYPFHRSFVLFPSLFREACAERPGSSNLIY